MQRKPQGSTEAVVNNALKSSTVQEALKRHSEQLRGPLMPDEALMDLEHIQGWCLTVGYNALAART